MGHWQDLHVSWHETTLTHCELCGQLIPKTAWVAEIAGGNHLFCDAACEALYRDYWLPRYATNNEPAGGHKGSRE